MSLCSPLRTLSVKNHFNKQTNPAQVISRDTRIPVQDLPAAMIDLETCLVQCVVQSVSAEPTGYKYGSPPCYEVPATLVLKVDNKIY